MGAALDHLRLTLFLCLVEAAQLLIIAPSIVINFALARSLQSDE